jgi:hypothetical protein
MSESTLSLSFTNLKTEVGFFLGYGRSGWTADQTSEIESLVQAGVRRVYYPIGTGPNAGYEWSWLRPTVTLEIVAGDGDYDLPDNFGRLIGNLHYAPGIIQAEIKIISLESILELRSRLDESSPPWFAAVRPKTQAKSVGQRWEILFYPKPDANYTLYCNFEAYSGILSTDYPYPLGGMELSELYVESCLAVAEQRANDESGLHGQVYQALLIDAIARDRKRGARFFGPMGDHESEVDAEFHRSGDQSPYPVTYKGVLI